ncbi:2-keto-4-pentenoate hydratase [Motiliproteus coralliicola]|uniref:2-keto-4-pentenoate hydratase n=1 Tax=Motiliproteus coralliicola TaxID=2283196 RepID=A0A369WSB9_9GAMM|nr:fumarylacetoacetate hydrolase family protein [Motiliproteus coralliicola]RDE24451.1 2-keto-4-pentenoate hydratase [Motiliproteus coralliicola]
MKLATLIKDANGNSLGRDGQLVIVSRDLTRAQPVPEIAPTLQAALDNWQHMEPELQRRFTEFEQDPTAGETFDPKRCGAPLPRAYHWADGSAYLNHVALVRKARGAEMPPSFEQDPLIYQGGSDIMLGPTAPIIGDPRWGIDFEAEVVVITTDLDQGSTPDQCESAIALLTLVNDVSLRNLIPNELAKGFGFYQSKPASAFAPVVLTPDELAPHWQSAKLNLPLRVWLNDQPFGYPDAGVDMNFNFAQLLAHCCKTRALGAGTLLGSGTVSNKQQGLWGSSIVNGGVGYCCLAELRMYEAIEQGQPSTPFLGDGDRVRIEMTDQNGMSLFGTIEQQVVAIEAS